MNAIDIIIGLLLVAFAIRGFIKGFVISLASLAGLVAGIYAAYHFSDYIKTQLEGFFSLSPNSVKLIAFLLTFLLVLVLVHLLAKIVEKIFSAAGLGLLNKVAGLFLGLIKGALIVTVLIYFFHLIGGPSWVNEKTLENSILYKPVSKISIRIIGEVSEWVQQNPSSDEPAPNLPEV